MSNEFHNPSILTDRQWQTRSNDMDAMLAQTSNRDHSLKLALDFTGAYSTDGRLSLNAIRGGVAVDYSRTGTALVQDWEGIYRQVADDEPRFQSGRFVENRVLHSNDFEGAGWVTLNATITSDATEGPFPGTRASRIVDDATDGAHWVTQGNLFVDHLYGQKTLSIYIRKGTNRYVGLSRRSWTSVPTSRISIFDFNTGTFEFSPTSERFSVSTEGLAPGWYRISTAHVTSNASDDNIVIGFADGTDPNTDGEYIGTGDSIIIYGAQAEITSRQLDPAPSEYLETTTERVSQWYCTKRSTNACLYSNDFADAEWTKQANVNIVGTVDGPGIEIGEGPTVGTEIEWATPTTGQGIFQSSIISISDGYVGDTDLWTRSVWIKGSTAGTIRISDPNNSTRNILVTVTTSWRRVSTTQFNTVGTSGIWFRKAGATSAVTPDTIYLAGAQFERSDTVTSYKETEAFIVSSPFNVKHLADGLLVEPARTNLCLHSNDYANVAWVSVDQGAKVTNSTIAPDGSLTADTLIDNEATGTGQARAVQLITVSLETDYIIYRFVKAAGLDWYSLRIGGSGAQSIVAYYDLTNGVLGATVGVDNNAQGIWHAGNGWYLCWIAFTSDVADADIQFADYVAEGDGDITVDLDGTSSVYVWGANLQEGQVPTTPVITEGTSASRNDDVAAVLTFNWYDTTKDEVWYVDWTPAYTDEDTLLNNAFAIWKTNTQHRRHMISTTTTRTGESNLQARDGTDIAGSSMFAIYTPGYPGNRHRMMSLFSPVERDGTVTHANNGTLDNGATHNVNGDLVPVTLAIGRFGNNTDGNKFATGPIAELRYYDQMKTEDEAVDASANGLPIV